MLFVCLYNLPKCLVPGVVQNLICAKRSTPTELSFYWELPTVLGNEVVGYRVEVKGLRHKAGTREVIHFDVDGFNTDMKEATINQGLGNVGILSVVKDCGSFLAAGEVPYNITVEAVNLAGCSQEQQIYCFTQEGGMVQESTQ